MRVLVSLVLALALVFAARPASADRRSEAVAKAAIKKAQSDYRAQNYGTGFRRLHKAVAVCGKNRCSAATRAGLLRDLGVMQFRKGDQDGAAKSWAEAAKLAPGLAMNPAYDAPDVDSAFASATGSQPTGDFAHTPPVEQAVNTPVPVYVEGGSDAVVSVFVKYQAPGATSWKRIQLKKVGSGWGGLIPCGGVTSGTLRYYVEGLDATKSPVATNGDRKHPYTVAIVDQLSGEPPHLPGMAPPQACSQSTECPPDLPGCKNGGEGNDESGDRAESGGESKPAGRFKRFWVGAGAEVEFISVPSGDDLCALDPTSALPLNSHDMYCTAQDGSDFPTHAYPAQNVALCTPDLAAKGVCPGDAGGTSGGGIVPGDLRLMASFDYAVTENLLAGVRIGATLFKYPASVKLVPGVSSSGAAAADGRAYGFLDGRLYFDVRGTWVFGEHALSKPGLKPMVFVGGGAAAFDGHTSSAVALCPAYVQYTQAGQPAGQCSQQSQPRYGPPKLGTVNIWEVSGPGFFLLGGGVRWVVSDSIAFTGAVRFNGSFGPTGLVPTYGPELGIVYGF